MELYISDHPLDCLTCSANNDCELQDQAAAVGLRDVRYGYEGDNHLGLATDTSNPYFDFDPTKCIVCSRCVRACDEVQGTFALTIDGRGFASMVSAGQDGGQLPRLRMRQLRRLRAGLPDRDAAGEERQGDRQARARGGHHLRLLRRRLHLPRRDARRAARAHGPVEGRQGQPRPLVRQGPLRLRLRQPQGPHPQPDDPRDASTSRGAKSAGTRRSASPPTRSTRSRPSTARRALGGITSSRCTNEETFLVQKLVRAAFGTNNVDTCARVCHSPTGYGLKTTFGTSAGTQDFDIGDGHRRHAGDRRQPDRRAPGVRQPHEAPPAPGRQADRDRPAPDRPRPHRRTSRPRTTCRCSPGTNVAVLTSLAHVIVTEGLANEAFIRERCDWDEYQDWAALRVRREAQPRVPRAGHPRPRGGLARGRAALRHRRQRRRSTTASA